MRAFTLLYILPAIRRDLVSFDVPEGTARHVESGSGLKFAGISVDRKIDAACPFDVADKNDRWSQSARNTVILIHRAFMRRNRKWNAIIRQIGRFYR